MACSPFVLGSSGVQVDQRVFKDLVVERMPKLNLHLERHNIDLSLVTFNFFLTISVDSVPIETALRILDCFLLEGDKVGRKRGHWAALCPRTLRSRRPCVVVFRFYFASVSPC
jgi:hypothetical protein